MYIPLYPTKCPTIVSNPNPHDHIMVVKSHSIPKHISGGSNPRVVLLLNHLHNYIYIYIILLCNTHICIPYIFKYTSVNTLTAGPFGISLAAAGALRWRSDGGGLQGSALGEGLALVNERSWDGKSHRIYLIFFRRGTVSQLFHQ
jgi:hypothetical protein